MAKKFVLFVGMIGLVTAALLLGGCARGDFTLAQTSYSVAVPQGRSGTVKIDFTRTQGFAGKVKFEVTGLPTGVTATFDPVETDTKGTTTTLTLRVAETVKDQKYSLKIVATSGKLKKEVPLELTVQVKPDYTLAVSPASLTIQQGKTGTVTVNLTRTDTFKTDAVALSLEGAPAGVTGTFNPASATGASSTLTLNVAATAAPGRYTLTVRGKATGLTDKTATITLTVEAAPDFSLAVTPTAVTLRAGAEAQVNVAITRVGGFAEAVNFTATGLPTGVTAEFDPNPAPAGTTTLKLTSTGDAAPGTYTVTVRGTAGALSKTATFTLTITAP